MMSVKDFFQKQLLKLAGILSRIIGKIHGPYNRKKVVGKDYREYKKILKLGDVISTRSSGEFSNLFIPGFWGHVGIVISETTVMEATTHGVIETDLVDFFMNRDYLAVCRPNFLSDEQMIDVASYCREFVGLPYDWEFRTSDIKQWYCSELIYMALQASTKNNPFKLRKILGQDTIAPSDFWEATDKFERVFRSQSFTKL